MTLDKQTLSDNATLVALAARLSRPKTPPTPVKVQVGSIEIDVTALEVALTALKTGKWTSIKPALKSVDSPLAEIDYQDIADKEKKALPGATTKEAFVHHLEEVAKEAGLDSPIVDAPIEVVRASKTEILELDPQVEEISAELADAMTGAMVALLPTPEHQERLAAGTNTPPDQIHLTLRFLGNDHKVYTDEQKFEMVESLREGLVDTPFTVGEAFGVSLFNPKGDKTALVLNVGGAALESIHYLVCSRVACDQEEHKPWVAHITMEYTKDLAMVPKQFDKLGPVEFDRVRLAFGGDNWDLPLGVALELSSDDNDEVEGESHD